jgi:hypothetical protein
MNIQNKLSTKNWDFDQKPGLKHLVMLVLLLLQNMKALFHASLLNGSLPFINLSSIFYYLQESVNS